MYVYMYIPLSEKLLLILATAVKQRLAGRVVWMSPGVSSLA